MFASGTPAVAPSIRARLWSPGETTSATPTPR
jgi:hypothetical protein